MKLGPLKIAAVAAALSLLGGVIALAPGCTILVSDQPLDDASPGIYSSCNECLYQTCMAEWSVCGTSADCMAIYTCSTAPGCDQACVDACYTSHTTGQSRYYSLASCDYQASKSATCTPLCSPHTPDSGTPDTAASDGDVDGATADAGDAAALPDDSAAPDSAPVADASTPFDGSTALTCNTCASQKCAAERAACTVNTPCDTYIACLVGCTTGACVDQCGAANPDGKTTSGKYSDCLTASCSRECGLSQ